MKHNVEYELATILIKFRCILHFLAIRSQVSSQLLNEGDVPAGVGDEDLGHGCFSSGLLFLGSKSTSAAMSSACCKYPDAKTKSPTRS